MYTISYLAAVSGYSPPTPNPNTPKNIVKTTIKQKFELCMSVKCTEVHIMC